MGEGQRCGWGQLARQAFQRQAHVGTIIRFAAPPLMVQVQPTEDVGISESKISEFLFGDIPSTLP